MIDKKIELFKCDQYDYQSQHRDKVRNHVEAIHTGIIYDCDKCSFQTGHKKMLKATNPQSIVMNIHHLVLSFAALDQ